MGACSRTSGRVLGSGHDVVGEVHFGKLQARGEVRREGVVEGYPVALGEQCLEGRDGLDERLGELGESIVRNDEVAQRGELGQGSERGEAVRGNVQVHKSAALLQSLEIVDAVLARVQVLQVGKALARGEG